MNRPTLRPLLMIASTSLCLAALAACSSGPQSTNTGRGAEVHFSELDGDDNRMLTRDELDPNLTLAIDFDRYDSDGNGSIELDEFYEYVKDNR